MTALSAQWLHHVEQIRDDGWAQPILHPGTGDWLCKLVGHRSETLGKIRDINGEHFGRLVCTRCGYRVLGMPYPRPKPRPKNPPRTR